MSVIPQSKRTAISMTSREFNQDTARAKRAAKSGPVYVTDRGIETHVLLSIDDYEEMRFEGRSIAELLSSTPGVGDIEFDPPRSRDLPRDVDLS